MGTSRTIVCIGDCVLRVICILGRMSRTSGIGIETLNNCFVFIFCLIASLGQSGETAIVIQAEGHGYPEMESRCCGSGWNRAYRPGYSFNRKNYVTNR